MKKKAKRPAPTTKAKAARKPAEQSRSARKPFPKGYSCEQCEQFNEFPLYVAAHSQERLQHVCRCGARYSILDGIATQVKP